MVTMVVTIAVNTWRCFDQRAPTTGCRPSSSPGDHQSYYSGDLDVDDDDHDDDNDNDEKKGDKEEDYYLDSSRWIPDTLSSGKIRKHVLLKQKF